MWWYPLMRSSLEYHEQPLAQMKRSLGRGKGYQLGMMNLLNGVKSVVMCTSPVDLTGVMRWRAHSDFSISSQIPFQSNSQTTFSTPSHRARGMGQGRQATGTASSYRVIWCWKSGTTPRVSRVKVGNSCNRSVQQSGDCIEGV